MTVLLGLLLLSIISAALTASRHIITSVQPTVCDPNREEVNAVPRYAQPGTDNYHPVVEGSAQVPGKLSHYASAAGGRNLNHDYPGLPEAAGFMEEMPLTDATVDPMRARYAYAYTWFQLHRTHAETKNVWDRSTQSEDPTTPKIKQQRSDPFVQSESKPEMRSTPPKSPMKQSRRRKQRPATSTKVNLWPHGVIPYEIDDVFPSPTIKIIRQAMRVWEASTCISFVEREPQHHTFINFTSLPCGYCSFVGRKYAGSALMVSIVPSCKRPGQVIHELGHVMGFHHEQSRPDRDDYVEILKDNILREALVNFEKVYNAIVDSLGEPYDYDSIMHYNAAAYAKPGANRTIVPKKCCPRPRIGQRVRPSPGDIRRVNKLYKCPSCGQTLLEHSGTFASPPSELLRANTEAGDRQSKPESLAEQFDEIQRSEAPLFCQWRIIANRGERIHLNFIEMDMTSSTNGLEHDEKIADLPPENSRHCVGEYVEVRDGYASESLLLGRFCGTHLPPMLTSSSPRMLIEYRRPAGQSTTGFVAHYHTEHTVFSLFREVNKQCL